jgi:hypothetical protein
MRGRPVEEQLDRLRTALESLRRRVIELGKGRLVRDQSRGVYGYQH